MPTLTVAGTGVLRTSNPNYSEHTSYTYNGIDRVDSSRSKGYVLTNVVPCCHICNRAKMDLSREDFLSWLERAHSHSIGAERRPAKAS